MAQLKWGMIGVGKVGKKFAYGLAQTDTSELVAIADMVKESAEELANEYNVSTVYGSADELIADSNVDIVYIAIPHTLHTEWSIRALDAGKHVLCEKPMSINESDAKTVLEAARRNGKFFMEAYMFKCHPQTHKLVEIVKSGAIGEVRVIDASFSWPCTVDLKGRMFNPEFAGGGLLDMGCYPIAVARLVAGAALGKDFADPVDVQAMAHIGKESHVDEWTVGMFRFENDILATLGTGVTRDDANMVVISGSEGRIESRDLWKANDADPGETAFTIEGQTRDTETVKVYGEKSIYAYEAEAVAASIAEGKLECPYNQWADSLGCMAAMDRWREAIGLVYPCEKPAG